VARTRIVALTSIDEALVAAWPPLMVARLAAAYVGETSVESFRGSVGALWPRPLNVSGKGERWKKEDLDLAIERIAGSAEATTDLADVL